MHNFTVELIKTFSGLGRNDAAIAGGKGASLGEMTQVGVPVPSGYVVLALAFEQFLHETDLLQEIDAILATVNHQEMHTVEHASEQIQALIMGAKMPKNIAHEIERNFELLDAEFVAVRSSATAEDSASAAWAGQLDSFLNTRHTELLKNVQRCWASLFTPRAIFYRFEKELHLTKISVAVVVQNMVASEVSGIAFSVHPVTEDRNQLIIEAGFGLGEAIVSGQVTPDSYVVEKTPRKVLDINVSTQTRALCRAEKGGNEWQYISEPRASSQVLDEKQIFELSDLIVKIENHYGFPCDIEWVYEGGKFYIVQSRPITTLSNAAPVSESAVHLKLEALGVFDKDKWSDEGRWIQAPFVCTFFPHWNTSEVVRRIVPGLSFGDYFTLEGSAFMSKEDPQRLGEHMKKLYAEGTLGILTASIDQEGEHIFKKIEVWLAKDDAYARGHLQEFVELYREFAGFWMIEAYVGYQIARIAKEVGYVATEAELFGKVHPYLRKTWIETEVDDIKQLATDAVECPDDATIAERLEAYRQKYQWMKMVKWVGEPLSVAQAKERLREEVENIKQGNYIESHHATDKPDDIVALSVASAYWRAECGRIEMRAALRLKPVLESLARECDVSYEQLLLLSPEELVAIAQSPAPLGLEVLARERGFLSTVVGGEEVIVSAAEPEYQKIKNLHLSFDASQASGTLQGVGAAPGKVVGRARIVLSMKDAYTFEDGEILVAPETTPSFVPLMRKAAAILTGRGGITSHAAIVSRELKKPCVIAIKDVTKILQTGDVVEVDADKGIVRILERAKTVY